MDTQYTQGFKAGMAWREAEIIKLLKEDAGDWHEIAERCESGFCHCNAIALIKGEQK